MSAETPAAEAAGPYRLTTKGDASWVTPIPWLLEAPLAVILVYLVASGPLDPRHYVPALGVALAMLVIALPGLAQFAPDVRAWARRTATVGEDGITVDMSGHGPHLFAWSELGRVTTKPISHGMQLPQALHLVTDFYDHEGTRLPELTVHHSTYRAIVRTSEVNEDGVAFLQRLEETAVASGFDLETRTLLDLVVHPDVRLMHGISDETMAELAAGRLWHARRRALDDKREADRIPHALLLINCVLRKETQRTAREARLERPDDPIVRYYLAHAILADARASAMLTDPRAVARRKKLRAEGHAMLAELGADPVWGPRALCDLEQLESRALTRTEDEEAEAAAATLAAQRVRVARPEVPKPPKPVIPPLPGRRVPPAPRPEHDKPRVFDRESLEKLTRRGRRKRPK